MSLSKYYPRSDAFQPDRLVRRDESEQQNWTRTQIPAEPESHPAGNPQPDAIIDGISNQPGGNAAQPDRGEILEMATGLSPDQERTAAAGSDPANYMETAAAEARIEDAYRRGFEEGRATAELDYGDALRAMVSACQQLDTIRETLIQNSRNEVLDFAMAIAERIVRISVREQDRTILATIDEALQQAVKSDEFTVYLHPKDYETVSTKTEELVAGLSGLNNILIKKDNTIDQGGAKIESDNCTIDATVATQFEMIREELEKRL